MCRVERSDPGKGGPDCHNPLICHGCDALSPVFAAPFHQVGRLLLHPVISITSLDRIAGAVQPHRLVAGVSVRQLLDLLLD
jgi:hypothetical protein